MVSQIRSGELDVYKALDKFVSWLLGNGAAPRTVLTYVTALKGLLRYEGISLDSYQLRAKVELPPQVDVSLDRIPTREEMRSLLLNSTKGTRALIALLATSGLRIGEAAGLRVGSLELLSNKITLMSTRTKSRRTRVTFITDETAGFLREYLRERIDRKDEWLFPDDVDHQKPSSTFALYMRIHYVLKKLGLLGKLDPDSRRNQLHPHCFRKYFFSKLIGVGVDRGVAEYLMGHRFGLDNSYLRMDEDRLKREYMKAQDDFTFLADGKLEKESRKRVEELQGQLQERNRELAEVHDRLGRLEGLWEKAFEKKITDTASD